VRHKGLWLKPKHLMRWHTSDALHAHTSDACVQSFFAALDSWRVRRTTDADAHPPRRRHYYYRVQWKASAIRVKGERLYLANGRGNAPLIVPWAHSLPLQVEMGWDGRQYEIRATYAVDALATVPVEDGKVAGVDLGEIVRHEVACVIVRRKDRTGCPIICTLRGTAFRQRDVECPRTMDPQPQGWYANREGRVHLRASMGKGTRVDGMASISEPLISIVTRYEAKDADRLRLQRVRGLISPTSWAPNAVGVERAPNPILLHMRNVVSPSGSLWESDSQEKLIARRVWDGGESESRPVMGRIGVAR